MRQSVLTMALCAAVVLAFAASAADSPGTPADKEAIVRLMEASNKAFNDHDASAYARLYTPDADLVNVRGERMKGRDEILNALGRLFASRAASATLRNLDMDVRFISSDIALVHVRNEMKGLRSGNETVAPHIELSLRVVVRQPEGWRVAAFHNTLVDAP